MKGSVPLIRMVYRSRWLLSSLLTMTGLMSIPPGAIAQPRTTTIPANLPVNRISRDLTRSPSEDFFRQGQIQLEQEIQQLTRNRELLTKDVLKVSPDERSFPDEIKERQEIEGRGQR